jgi:murein DD-endopeptidase MepM/ murein hydrolase activator NlpD
MRIFRAFLLTIVLAAIAAGAAYFFAGRAQGPEILVTHPPIIGQAALLDVVVKAPAGLLDSLSIQLEQKGHAIPIYTSVPGDPALQMDGPDRVHVARTIGKKNMPDLQAGAATLVVTATRPVLRGLRHVTSTTTKDVQVRFDPPRITVVSTKHYINLGGSEFIVYRVTPPDVVSGVKVGDLTYPGFPAAGAGVPGDPSLKVAFFALRYDQPMNTPMDVYARDAAGNEAHAQFDRQLFPKAFKHSRIMIDDTFLGRVVPAILLGSPQLKANPADLVPSFLTINNDLRRVNAATIAALSTQTSPTLLWKGAFQPLGNSQVEAAFADYRTYIYGGKEIDQQVHLGFDLAKVVNSPILAANDGKVLYARDLGIYGNCVVLDHGMGVQSLYGHMSSFQVQEGQSVTKGQRLGQTGQTGMAGGDHLHFSMLVDGQFVNATEWWDPHWIQDRIVRKLQEAGAGGAAVAK